MNELVKHLSSSVRSQVRDIARENSIEITDDMLGAGIDALLEHEGMGGLDANDLALRASKAYAAMVAARRRNS